MTAGLIRSAETVFVAQMASSPRVMVTARPVKSTRPSPSSRSMRAPRGETCSPVKVVFDQPLRHVDR